MTQVKTPVDSIDIPPQYLELCESWHGGISSMLYAVASTGGLTLGSIRPSETETDDEWYLSLWSGLSGEVSHVVNVAENQRDADLNRLKAFEEWVDKTEERLRTEYGLDD